MFKRNLIILFIFVSLNNCSTVKPVADKDYKFKDIKVVGVVGIQDYNNIRGSGGIVLSAVSEKLLSRGLKIVTREPGWEYIDEKEFQMTGVTTDAHYPQVLLKVYIMKYELEEKRVVPVTIEDKGSVIVTKTTETTIEQAPLTKKASQKKAGKVSVESKVLNKIETEVTEKKLGTTTHTYQLGYWQAKVALNLRMIDVKTGKSVWLSNSNYSAIDIASSLKGSVTELLIPLEVLRDSD